MSGQADDMQVNGTEGVELAPQPIVVAVQPSVVVEPEDRLVAQPPPPAMPVAEAGPSQVPGGAVPAVPVLHLHRHEHVEGTVDQEARAVVERLATQHGELFSFLHEEIKSVKEDYVQKQFAEEVVAWAGWVQVELGRQGHELRALRRDLEKSHAAVLEEVEKCKRETRDGLVHLRALIPETQKPITEALRKVSTQVTGMTEDWGKDVTRLMSMTQNTESTLTTRLNTLVYQNEQDHARLHERIEGETQRQTVLMTSMEAMETQMRELMSEEKASVSEDISLAGRLPLSLSEELTVPPRPAVRDSAASPTGRHSEQGSGSSEHPKKPLMIQNVQGAGPQFSMQSEAAPATRMVSHMGTADTNPQTAGTSVGGAGGAAAAATTSVGVGQMKLDAPPRYGGGRRPGVRVWLSHMERYMRLMKYPPEDWLDVVAMRVEGAASSWMNAALVAIERNQRPRFLDWADFSAALIAAFEPVTELEEARKALRALRQTGKVATYIQKFQELQCRLPGMTEEEAFSSFMSGLNAHLQEHVGAHVLGDLEAAKRMALRMEMYRGTAETSRSTQQKSQGGQKGHKQKGTVHSVEAQAQPAGPSQVNAVQSQGQQKRGKGKGKKGKRQEQEASQRQSRCFSCGGDHAFRQCPIWQEIQKKCGMQAKKKQGNA